jgi:hypothetical protein
MARLWVIGKYWIRVCKMSYEKLDKSNVKSQLSNIITQQKKKIIHLVSFEIGDLHYID